MALPYKRITEEEDQMRNVLDKGEYAFSVLSCEQKLSKKKGDKPQYEMLEVELLVLDQQGREVKVKDWIVFMDEMAWKFRHFAATCRLMDEYDRDALVARDFLGKDGVVKITQRTYEQDGETRYANAVADYIKPHLVKAQSKNDDFNDDIDF